MRFPAIFTALLASATLTLAQEAVERRQAFLDLSNDGVLMNLSAHPDDEDGATLALYRMRFGVKTYTVLFTRGEGGQNEKGPELYEELGVLRSEETRSAGRILGAEVRFLNFLDFGYSKTATETFRQWGGQQEVLRRLVFTIRRYRPDVLFSNHNTIDGHGHHQAVAITALAAFDAAADPTIFPEQLRLPGIAPWQPRKLFFRAWGRMEPAADVSNPVVEKDSLRGLTYLEIAADALREHRTQGMERINPGAFGRWKSLYRLVRASSLYERDTTTFFGGMDLWRDHSLSPLRPVRTELSRLNEQADPAVTLRSVSRLMSLTDTLAAFTSAASLGARILGRWREGLEHLAALLSGIRVRAAFEDTVITPGQEVLCTVHLERPGGAPAGARCALEIPPGWQSSVIPAAVSAESKNVVGRFRVRAGPKPVFTVPRAVAQYRPIESEESITALVAFDLGGLPFVLRASPAADVAPREILAVQPAMTCVSPARLRSGATFAAKIHSYIREPYEASVRLVSPAEWKCPPARVMVAGGNGPGSARLAVAPPADVHTGEYALRFATAASEAEAIVRVFDVSVPPRLRVGIIRSYDNTFETALQDLGVEFGLLSEADLHGGDLSRYNTIVIDIRAYLVREDLRANNARLLEYVRNGGHLIVMYQREQEWRPEYAPFPFAVSRRRITTEDAPVSILEPKNRLFNEPNRIADADWGGWKQERAVYLPTNVPAQYHRLISSHDPDEPEEDTGYLLTEYGRGTYIYTSFVWYRQLREHLPGAVRCFANMVSYPLAR